VARAACHRDWFVCGHLHKQVGRFWEAWDAHARADQDLAAGDWDATSYFATAT